jgi:hypothetical protein
VSTIVTASMSFELTASETSKRDGYIVSVVGGPQDLIKRTTIEAALRDGRAYVERYYEITTDGWRPRGCLSWFKGAS